MHRASLQYLFTNIKDTHLTIGLDSIFFQNHLQLRNQAIEKSNYRNKRYIYKQSNLGCLRDDELPP